MNITIIGVGLIGGSMALSLRGFQTHIIGVDKNEEHCSQALELGLVDEVLPMEEAIPKSHLVILAIPVDSARETLPYILDNISDNTVVTDMGSTKSGICGKVRNHRNRKNYVAAHPIAGTENSGPKAAFSSLYKGKMTIICERELSADFALAMVEKMFKILEMNVIYMKPEEHDRHIAYVSHISHITSFVLGLTVLDIEKDENSIFDMAGSGFASTVRLAKSSPQMWAPIFVQNAEHISIALGAYIEKLQLFKNLIDNRNSEKAIELMKEANDIRRILDGIK